MGSREFDVMKGEKAFDCFLRCLLAMINRSVEMPIRQTGNLTGRIQVVARLDKPRADEVALGVIHKSGGHAEE